MISLALAADQGLVQGQGCLGGAVAGGGGDRRCNGEPN